MNAPLTPDTFRQDVLRAYQQGRITLPRHLSDADMFALFDPDSFLEKDNRDSDGFQRYSGTLAGTNTRKVSDLATHVSEYYFRTPHARWLDLGAGIGVGAGEAYANNYEVDTLTRSPIAPRLRPRDTVFWLQNVAKHRLQLCTTATARRLYDTLQNTPDTELRIPMQDVLTLHNEFGVRYFQLLDHDFLHHQYIGDFPAEVRLPREEYDIIYESCGALFHQPVKSVRLAIQSTLGALKPTGTLCIDYVFRSFWKYYEEAVQQNPAWIAHLAEDNLLLTGREGPLGQLPHRSAWNRHRSREDLLAYLAAHAHVQTQ